MNHKKTASEQIGLIIETAKQNKIKLPYKINHESLDSICDRIRDAKKNRIYIKRKKLSPKIYEYLIENGFYVKEVKKKLSKVFKIYWKPELVELKRQVEMITPILNDIKRDINIMKNTINQIVNLEK
jgi:hypothetical protein